MNEKIHATIEISHTEEARGGTQQAQRPDSYLSVGIAYDFELEGGSRRALEAAKRAMEDLDVTIVFMNDTFVQGVGRQRQNVVAHAFNVRLEQQKTKREVAIGLSLADQSNEHATKLFNALFERWGELLQVQPKPQAVSQK